MKVILRGRCISHFVDLVFEDGEGLSKNEKILKLESKSMTISIPPIRIKSSEILRLAKSL